MLKWICISLVLWCTVATAQTWNNPHQGNGQENVRHGAFSGPPKTLDPARSYSSDEALFIAQIYEPPLQYHFLKRPYTLEPLTTIAMPTVTYYDKHNGVLAASTSPDKVAYSVYDITIKPGIVYEPHPAFAKKAGQYRYHDLSPKALTSVQTLHDFKHTASRELTAQDYVYEIKRLASPRVQSPIYGVMSRHIVGFSDYGKALQQAYQRLDAKAGETSEAYLDLRQHPIEGVRVVSRYHYQIKIKGVYPQFRYWLAMPFFAPIPWEVDKFFSQPGMKSKHLSLDWLPVGTGPYRLIENNPNKQMVLQKNPNFRHETYPTVGDEGDKSQGYLAQAGKRLPFVDKFVFSLDKESIPRWNKFLQGYYDAAGVSNDSFDQAISIDNTGKPELTPELKKKGMHLKTTIDPAVFYIGFNMLDDIVGGYSARARKLRQAISIAVDYEEYIALFLNGRGIAAQGPLPPSIFGYREGRKGINDVVYFWDGAKAKRRPLVFARDLLSQAGYPGGIDPKTGKPLILNYDVTSSGGPDDKARFNWFRKQFAKLGIQLNVRSTQYNRFQDKVRRGNAQLFSWGWMADYPDPENFLFLLHGPNGKVKYGGENAANYHNPEVDRLFNQIKNIPDGQARQHKIDQLLAIVKHDAPWIWGVHPINFTVSHQWNAVSKPNAMARNTLKYLQLDAKKRQRLRHQWNSPVTWPLWLLFIIIILILVPLAWIYWRRESRPSIRRMKE